MGLTNTFFFDTYAFFEILDGNPSYAPYSKGVSIITTKFNRLELHYGLMLQCGKEEADQKYDEYVDYTIVVEDRIFKKASEFRAQHKERKLSYVDCVGYIIAKTVGIKFLTGDKQFVDLENVEFVK